MILADDHQMFLDGMVSILSNDNNVEVLGTAMDGVELLELVKTKEPDIVISDIRMPRMDGIEATKFIKRDYPSVKVLILTMHTEKDLIRELMSMGASGYVLKNKSSAEILMAIHNLHYGIAHYSLEILDIAALASNEQEELVNLTPREQEILTLIAKGLTTRQIATQLFIAEPTVNTHRRNLMQKLDVSSSRSLIKYCIEHGLIKSE